MNEDLQLDDLYTQKELPFGDIQRIFVEESLELERFEDFPAPYRDQNQPVTQGILSEVDQNAGRATETHSRDKQDWCDVCNKSFSRRRYLPVHRRTHTGEKPYSCVECGMAFAQQANLRSHRITHTGEKPFLCDVCGLSFSHQATLRYHRITHSGERPHLCGVCGKSFARKSYLQKHRQRHTS